MDIGGYSTIDALRGEMEASLVKSRVMETMLLYVIDTMNSKFNNVNPAVVSSNYLVAPRRYQPRQAAASVTQRALNLNFFSSLKRSAWIPQAQGADAASVAAPPLKSCRPGNPYIQPQSSGK